MLQPASEASAAAVRRILGRIATYRFTGSAVLLVLFLVSITTDVAGRFGLIPFGVVLGLHLRRARGRRPS
jgi:hypothetical protein